MIDHQKHNQFKVFIGFTFHVVAQAVEDYFYNETNLRPKSMSIGLVNGRYFLTVGFVETTMEPHYAIRLRSEVLGGANLLYEANSLEKLLTTTTDGREVICHDLFVEQDLLSLYTMETV